MNRFIAAAAGVLIVLWASGLATGQTRPQKPRDLEGIWTNATVTPFERPADAAGKAYFTPEEAAAFEKQARDRNNADRREGNSEADLTTGYNDFWWDRGTKVVSTLRTSI